MLLDLIYHFWDVLDLAEDVYEQLRRKMNVWPMRAPKSKYMLKLLKIVYTPEEADLVSSAFSFPFADAKTVVQVAEQTGRDVEYVRSVCERLADRGALFEFTGKEDGATYYSMLPFAVGLFEFYLDDGVVTDDKREFMRVYEEMHRSWGHELGASKYPLTRVIPVEEKLDVEHEILPFEKVSEYVENARSIAVNPCVCRMSANRCEKPIDVCISFDGFADYRVKHRQGRYVTKEEALELLKIAEDNGLIHTVSNQQDKPLFICNCCTCCCGIMRGLSELHNPRTFAKSNFMPEIDRDACKLCEKCVEVCPFQALFHHYPHNEDLSDDMIMILEERCVGCGICAHQCPHDAITLVRVREEIPVKRGREAAMKFEAERIH